MKTLSIIRHAKSSWRERNVTDRGRPLNARGQRDAPVMAARYAHKHERPDIVISSPARRAAETALAFASALGYPQEKIDFRDEIYEASPSTLIDLFRRLDDAANHALCFGHNPTITDVVDRWAPADITNVPTCGVATFIFGVEKWSDI